MPTNLAALETLGGHLRVNSDRQTLAMARREALERQLADAELIQPRPGPAAIVSRPGVPAPPEAAAVRLERLRQELTELRSQYVLGFYPPDGVKPGSKWREVTVQVSDGKAKTIRGYYP